MANNFNDKLVEQALRSNNHLPNEVKAVLVEIDFVMETIGKDYIKYNQKEFIDTCRYLRIRKTNDDKLCSFKNGVLFINNKLLLSDDYDIPRVIMPYLIFPNSNHHGVFFGTKEIICNNVYGDNSKPEKAIISDEYIIATFLSSIVDFNIMAKAVAENNQDIIKVELLKKGISFEKINNLLTRVDDNYENRKRTKISDLANIQSMLVDMFVIPDRQLIQTKGELLDPTSEYPGLSEFDDYLKENEKRI